MRNSNSIHNSAYIHPSVSLGSYNVIGPNVKIDVSSNNTNVEIYIGDNNIIHNNTRILINDNFCMGDWNVLHNDMLIMGGDLLEIGHNCWFGQNTILDGAGGLVIGNGVRVGMYSQIWTHVASGEQIEGCTLFSKRKTIIEDDVWLVGSCVVGSGLVLGKKSTALINSVITKNTIANKAYAGSPAKLLENVEFYKPMTIHEKFDMMKVWIIDFVTVNNDCSYQIFQNEIILYHNDDKVIFTKSTNNGEASTFFIGDKTFNKTNSEIERRIYKYLYGNRARFLPIK